MYDLPLPTEARKKRISNPCKQAAKAFRVCKVLRNRIAVQRGVMGGKEIDWVLYALGAVVLALLIGSALALWFF